ncbi:MAG: hypothetical protein WCS01_12175 [bacterium]
MSELHMMAAFAAQARGRRLKDMLGAAVCSAPPGGPGLVLGAGQDYQGSRGDEQTAWLTWCAQPGSVLLLVPPFRTGASYGPKNWGVADLEGAPTFPAPANGLLAQVAGEVKLLNSSAVPPFVIEDHTTASEELRLKHRYLDLRRPALAP